MEIETRQVPVEEIIDLRHRVLRAEMPRGLAHFLGDEKGVHFAALANGEVVGCCSLMPSTFDELPALQLRGMAVEPTMQRSGIGSKLLAAVEHEVAA